MDALEEQIIGYLGQQFGGRPVLDDSLALLGIDSVGMAELTFELEKRFRIQVGDDVLDVETVGELISYVRSKVRA